MSFQQLVYDSDQVRINAGGFAVSKGPGASGYAEGQFCTIEADGPSFTVKRGTDGTETRSKTLNRGTKVTIRTMTSNSPTNGFFSGLVTADEAGPNGASIISLVVEDMQGTSKFASDSAFLMGFPKKVYSGEAEELEWEFHAIRRAHVIGGN